MFMIRPRLHWQQQTFDPFADKMAIGIGSENWQLSS